MEPEQADVVHDLLARLAGRMIEMHEATGRLIDQIVYQLYGLTEEEIVVVEGNR